MRIKTLIPAMLFAASLATPSFTLAAQTLTPQQQLARDIYQGARRDQHRHRDWRHHSSCAGDGLTTTRCRPARRRRPGTQPRPRKGNLVARLRGSGARKPILLLAHLDVVEAKREDWSVDPFTLLEQDGYFYGRGTGDDKFMAAAFVANLIRYKQEGFKPDRDIIVVLETDEETLDRDAVGMQWLLKNHRDSIDAAFALNEGGGVSLKDGKPLRIGVQTSEKVPVNYLLEVKNPGGHSSQPTKDNAIYRLAAGLVRLSAYDFPVVLNETTRAWLERAAPFEEPQVGCGHESSRFGSPRFRCYRTTVEQTELQRAAAHDVRGDHAEAGHAFNALPQTARATVNCRVLPGESLDDVQATLVRVLADPNDLRYGHMEARRQRSVSARPRDHASNRKGLCAVLA